MYYLLIVCASGRFGVNCEKKCQCKNVTEDCQLMKGHCESGCAENFTGDTCQGNTKNHIVSCL